MQSVVRKQSNKNEGYCSKKEGDETKAKQIEA